MVRLEITFKEYIRVRCRFNRGIHSLESKSLERKTNPLVKLLNVSYCNMANTSIHKYSMESKSLEIILW
jgi:hypothetical protein